MGANTGFVNVGTDGNTAALAVESIRRWWRLAGQDAYPGAGRLLVTCDAGGSNGWRNRGWKAGLAELAAETGLQITVCHFPPGTSKWNKIEHRLFSQITLGWRGRPLTSYDVIINTISAVTTSTGLTVTAVLDDTPCPDRDPGQRPADQRHRGPPLNTPPVPRRVELRRPARPPARPGQPAPEPARPGRCSRDLLNHPALTGLDPAGLTALAAALHIPFRARREQRRYLRQGRARQRAESAGGGANRKLDLTDHVLALRLREHLNLPGHLIGTLLGADKTTISHATTLTAALLAASRSRPPPRRPASGCAPWPPCATTPPATASPSPPSTDPPA